MYLDKAKYKEYQRQYRLAHKIEIAEKGKIYYHKNINRNRARSIRYGKTHKLDCSRRSKKYYEKPGGGREKRMLNNCGITKEQYDRMYLEQLGLCAICHEPFDDKKPFIDHCHITKQVRGLVHNNCNFILGHANDSILKLGYAMEYLAKYSQEEAKHLPHIKITVEELMAELNIR